MACVREPRGGLRAPLRLRPWLRRPVSSSPRGLGLVGVAVGGVIGRIPLARVVGRVLVRVATRVLVRVGTGVLVRVAAGDGEVGAVVTPHAVAVSGLGAAVLAVMLVRAVPLAVLVPLPVRRVPVPAALTPRLRAGLIGVPALAVVPLLALLPVLTLIVLTLVAAGPHWPTGAASQWPPAAGTSWCPPAARVSHSPLATGASHCPSAAGAAGSAHSPLAAWPPVALVPSLQASKSSCG